MLFVAGGVKANRKTDPSDHCVTSVASDVKTDSVHGPLFGKWWSVNSSGASRRGYIGIYTPSPPQKKKSAQVNFLWGKNDVTTAIQQFYAPKKLLYPQNKFLATHLELVLIDTKMKNKKKKKEKEEG